MNCRSILMELFRSNDEEIKLFIHLIAAILSNQRKLPNQMPVVNEHQIVDPNRASSSRHDAQFTNRFSKSFKSTRKSEASSPELMWSIPDMFLCLDSLGATVTKDSAPYDRVSYSESSFDRVK